MGLQKTNSVKMQINAFRGDDEIELGFPEGWDVTECRMAGHDRRALSDDEMRAALENPFGSPRLCEMAKGAKRVVIVFDDIPRPTPAYRIVPFVLDELHRGGVTDDQIRFLSAPGTHRPPTYREMLLKLGREIVEKYPVYNHNVWEGFVEVGKTSRGTPVKVNREFASCDLRVGVGSILPIGSTIRSGPGNFGGGGKLILPGVCSLDTVQHHHTHMEIGHAGAEVFRLDLEEAARLAGLHFKVDAVLNNRREVSGLFAGDMVAEHREGVKLAAEMYRSKTARNMDVVVANSYPDEIQLIKVMWCIGISLREGGDMVILSHAPDGQMFHQLKGRYGTDYGGRLFDPGVLAKKQKKAARIIVVAPDLSRSDRNAIGPAEKVIHCRNWGEALVELVAKNGPGTKAAVYPYGAIQTPDEEERKQFEGA